MTARSEPVKRAGAIAEADLDDRDIRAPGRLDVDRAVSHHDRAGRRAARKSDRLGEVARFGFGHGKGVAPGNPVEMPLNLQRGEKLTCEIFTLVGAEGEPRSFGSECL